MLVPLSWVEDYIKLSLSAEEIAHLLTLAGLEVDRVFFPAFSFRGVVAGKILRVSPHPNADKLKVAEVTDGKENYQVVCGAPNCEEGMLTAFAKVGASLTDAKGDSFSIKKAKLREVESFGMLCSEKELGLSDVHEGIMNLDSHTAPGTEISDLFKETIFEISLTPNLGHAMSMLGIARELAAMANLKAERPSSQVSETKEEKAAGAIAVAIDAPNECSIYSCRVIRNVKIGPSPTWLQKRLDAAGIRSINNIVDVTNYIALSCGQPLHAFDYDTIKGSEIHVKTNEKALPFKTLDDEVREVPANTLMIYDESDPIAIAGVMGGATSEVTEKTTSLLLEAAHFSPTSVRQASKKLGIRSEASSRFEKGIDPLGVTKALDEAAALIQQISGGTILQGQVTKESTPFKQKTIRLRIKRVNDLLGITLSFGEIESFLKRLEMAIKPLKEGVLEVTIPSYRNDLHHEIDLIEEVARIYGYNNIEKSEGYIIPSPLPDDPMLEFEQKMRTLLLREGLQEFLTCDLISPKLSKLALEKNFSEHHLIHVLQPSSIDQSILRTSLLPGLLQAIKHNQDRQNNSIAAFEIGRVHFKEKSSFQERLSGAIILSGRSDPYHFQSKESPIDFYDLKGTVENILEALDIRAPLFSASSFESFHPGKQAEITAQGMRIGAFGEVHPKHLEVLDIEGRVFFAQLDLQDLFSTQKSLKQMTPLPQFPGSDRDWTLTLNKEVPIGVIFSHLAELQSKLLKDCVLLDLYESATLGNDVKNVTLRFTYRNDQKTVQQAEVEKEHARLIKMLSQKLHL